jgi:hypothetical protein
MFWDVTQCTYKCFGETNSSTFKVPPAVRTSECILPACPVTGNVMTILAWAHLCVPLYWSYIESAKAHICNFESSNVFFCIGK